MRTYNAALPFDRPRAWSEKKIRKALAPEPHSLVTPRCRSDRTDLEDSQLRIVCVAAAVAISCGYPSKIEAFANAIRGHILGVALPRAWCDDSNERMIRAMLKSKPTRKPRPKIAFAALLGSVFVASHVEAAAAKVTCEGTLEHGSGGDYIGLKPQCWLGSRPEIEGAVAAVCKQFEHCKITGAAARCAKNSNRRMCLEIIELDSVSK
jgi:hypothetical protein